MPLNQQDLATIADTQKKKPEVAVTNRANAGTIFLPVMFKSTHCSCLPSLLILLQYLNEGRHQDQIKSRFLAQLSRGWKFKELLRNKFRLIWSWAVVLFLAWPDLYSMSLLCVYMAQWHFYNIGEHCWFFDQLMLVFVHMHNVHCKLIETIFTEKHGVWDHWPTHIYFQPERRWRYQGSAVHSRALPSSSLQHSAMVSLLRILLATSLSMQLCCNGCTSFLWGVRLLWMFLLCHHLQNFGYPLNVPSKKGKPLFFPRILPEGSLHLLPVFSLFCSSSGGSFHHLVS